MSPQNFSNNLLQESGAGSGHFFKYLRFRERYPYCCFQPTGSILSPLVKLTVWMDLFVDNPSLLSEPVSPG